MNIELSFDRAFYLPGEPVHVTVCLSGAAGDGPVFVQARVTHLAQPVQNLEQEARLLEAEMPLRLTLMPPPVAPRGYGLDVSVETANGVRLGYASAGFDVLRHWTETPRYGFLSDFAPGREDARQVMQALARYHVNALQFYDWMYRHDQLLPPQETYVDPLGRALSLRTVKQLIAAAHEHNIAAMPYTAVYASSIPFFEQHPEWALYQADGAPHFFGEDFLVYMDPRPGSPWTRHLLAQFDALLGETDFDGIHLDQYGEPVVAYDVTGSRFDLAEPLAALIDATAEVVSRRREGGAVVFNAVRNWPVRAVGPTDQDLVYIEVWEPYVGFRDLHTLVVEAQRFGGGKPVVLAAYVDPAWTHNVRLMDAIIFASGGGHIELGEHADLLADPYFPNYKAMPADLRCALRRYYDFVVRYQDVIGPRTQSVADDDAVRVTVEGQESGGGEAGAIWPILRRGARGLAISLVNLSGLPHGRWEQALGEAPTLVEDVTISVRGLRGEIKRVWFATPDGDDLAAHALAYSLVERAGEQLLTFTLPSLAYWDLVVLELATGETIARGAA